MGRLIYGVLHVVYGLCFLFIKLGNMRSYLQGYIKNNIFIFVAKKHYYLNKNEENCFFSSSKKNYNIEL
jgi:hypothetical protein